MNLYKYHTQPTTLDLYKSSSTMPPLVIDQLYDGARVSLRTLLATLQRVDNYHDLDLIIHALSWGGSATATERVRLASTKEVRDLLDNLLIKYVPNSRTLADQIADSNYTIKLLSTNKHLFWNYIRQHKSNSLGTFLELMDVVMSWEDRLPQDLESELLDSGVSKTMLIDYMYHCIKGPWPEFEKRIEDGYWQHVYDNRLDLLKRTSSKG